jgi:hypothetical protein
MTFLPDGRLVIAGGTRAYRPFSAQPVTAHIDPATEEFVEMPPMGYSRWYPTLTALGDGRTASFSGTDETGAARVKSLEFFTASAGWSAPQVAPWTPPNYPRTYLLPSGQLFYAVARPHLYNTATGAWTLNLPRWRYSGGRLYGTGVLWPLLPAQNYAARVMVVGGDTPATNTAEVFDFTLTPPAWRSLPNMAAARIQANAVLLPNGKVLVAGGSTTNLDASTASLRAELFDPATQRWSSAGTMRYPRLYHAVALLLPDATVVVAGSDPVGGQPHERRMEVYSPSYLFTTNASGATVAATRPGITGAPARVGYNATFTVDTPEAADIASAVLVRPGANTHAFDMEQRLVGLRFSAISGAVRVTSTPNASVAPPGYYMLFLVNRRGVPSIARFVQVTPVPANRPPDGTITLPAEAATVVAGQSLSFVGSGSDPDGTVSRFWWSFPGGTPRSSTARTPGAVRFSTPGTYVVSLTVTDNAGENDPSPPTRTVTVLAAPAPAIASTTESGPRGSTALAGTASGPVQPAASGSPTALAAAIASPTASDVARPAPPSLDASTPDDELAIVRLSPARGSTAGRTLLRVEGRGFDSSTGVTVGGRAATDVAVVSPTTLFAVAPGGKAGATQVAVTSARGSVTAHYEYVPARRILLADAFNGDDASGWILGAGSSVAGWAASGGTLDHDGVADAKVYGGSAGWTDYSVESRIEVPAGAVQGGGLRGRVDPASGGGYAVRLYPAEGLVRLLRVAGWALDGTDDVVLGEAPASFAAAAFHGVQLGFAGDVIQVELDGVEVLRVRDETYRAGAVALEGGSAPIRVDDVLVTRP